MSIPYVAIMKTCATIGVPRDAVTEPRSTIVGKACAVDDEAVTNTCFNAGKAGGACYRFFDASAK